MFIDKDTICALATPPGMGAISTIRLSGSKAIKICNEHFPSKDLTMVNSHTLHYGTLRNNTKVIDEVLVSIFKNPNSYTGEDIVEISCHGSIYVQNQIIQLLLSSGARLAKGGEFTLRAFANGKMDLSQAEAVSDLIASESESAHELAIKQMRGGFSKELKTLRAELINFASLIELELDFSEEDVEFADRQTFLELLNKIKSTLKGLIDSFAIGNVMKNGISVAIVGRPNVGKSTLLNSLVNEERAIVSSTAGTTRDTIEDIVNINGISFRFIDTAGLRSTDDDIESIGIKKALEKVHSSQIIVFVMDTTQSIPIQLEELENIKSKVKDNVLILINKIDSKPLQTSIENAIEISAKEKKGLNEFRNKLVEFSQTSSKNFGQTIISNNRHLEALNQALHYVDNIMSNIEANLSSDLLSLDVKQALHHLGEITGEVSTDDLLDNIFSNFCIGK
ncbi:MAG: tRNA uridine-5-carboxymethylaminomethyl(34) synthesis GTPase MnmE [Flavobacteriales bacterium]